MLQACDVDCNINSINCSCAMHGAAIASPIEALLFLILSGSV